MDWSNLRNRAALAGGVAIAAALLTINLAAIFWSFRYVFAINGLRRGAGDTVFYDARGRPWFRMDEQRRDVPLAQISPLLRDAVIAIEDHRFYHHHGIDLHAVLRASAENVKSHGVVQGGSTITQQLARTIFLSNARTWGRKAKEALLAVLMEQELPKNQILELYLNRVYLSGGVYGVENMSRKLYGKPARALSLPEAAIIAGLIRAPSALSPWSNYDGAIARSHIVLERMAELKYITPDAERAALAARPRIQTWQAAAAGRGAYAKEYLRQLFRDRFGGEHPPDWQVRTTFVPEIQDIAERAVANGLARLHDHNLQAALVAIDPRTGGLLAMVGGRDYSASQFNRAVRSRRQPGSAFKPFVYAAALERGYSPVSVLTGLTNVAAAGPEEWFPRNAHGEMQDEMTLRAALLESNNRAAVALEQKISTQPVLRIAGNLGMRGLPDVPSLALGTGEVSPLELTAAYGVFIDGGLAVPPRGILRVIDADGSTAYDNPPRPARVMTEQGAFQMVSMLEDVIDRGTGSSARSLGVNFNAGGKTGTTDEFKDGWFVGFSTSVVAGVWVGYDQPAPIGREAYGARVALPIWAEFMRSSARYLPPGRFEPPDGMRAEPLCKVSYLQPMQECPVYTEYFKRGDPIPSRICPIHGGPLKQRAERAVQGFFASLGKKLKSILGSR